MRCIFCKNCSDDSKSEEHVIPESLGNVAHVLPTGWVCDKCNNYLSREVEKPFLGSVHSLQARFTMCVPSKKGRIPVGLGLHARSRTRLDLQYSDGGGLSAYAAGGEDQSRWIDFLKSSAGGRLYIPQPNLPTTDYVTSRFIAKIAFEALALRCVDIPGWNDEIVEKKELDQIRNYVRLGNRSLVWPIHVRRIYPQDFVFGQSGQDGHEVLHEWDILSTSGGEYFVIIAIFGVEYAINLGGPELDGYLNWLRENLDQSPLYKNS